MAGEAKTPTASPGATPGAGNPDLIARLASAKSKWKRAAGALTGERDSLRTENTALKAENAELSTKADTSLSAKRVAELEAQIRGRTHRDKFNELAIAKGVRADALDDTWELSRYKAEKDEIDEAAMGAVIDSTIANRSYLKGDGSRPNPAQDGTPPPPPKPGAGSGQGGHHQAPFTLNDEQQSDTKYIWANFDRISEAASQRVQSGQI